MPNYSNYGVKIVKNAGMILEYIRMWLLSLPISNKIGHFKFVIIEEYQNQLRDFNCKINYLVFIPSFNDNKIE